MEERLTNSCKEIPTLCDNAEYWLQVYFKLKDYEDLEKAGKLITLPCKIGDSGTVSVWDKEGNEYEIPVVVLNKYRI